MNILTSLEDFLRGNYFSLNDPNKKENIEMLIKKFDGKYDLICSEKCFLDKIITMSTVKLILKKNLLLFS